jgi:hypothetical protein
MAEQARWWVGWGGGGIIDAQPTVVSVCLSTMQVASWLLVPVPVAGPANQSLTPRLVSSRIGTRGRTGAPPVLP